MRKPFNSDIHLRPLLHTLALAAGVALTTSNAGAASQVFTAGAGQTWTAPAGVTSVRVECWGAGGAGGSARNDTATAVGGNNTPIRGGGGGGGGYIRVNSLTVTPGVTYTFDVPAGAVAGSATFQGEKWDGSDTIFTNEFGASVIAKGGLGGGSSFTNNTITPGDGAVGTGGSSQLQTGGSAVFQGGNGATATINAGNPGGSGAGGGGAGDAGNGGNANITTAGAGGTGAPNAGGAGGNGRTTNDNPGNPGNNPGGGGGGAKGAAAGSDQIGGTGGSGQIILTWFAPSTTLYRSVANGNWNDTATWNTSTDGGATWGAAFTVPDESSPGIFITNGFTVTVDFPSTASVLSVASGSRLVLAAQLNAGVYIPNLLLNGVLENALSSPDSQIFSGVISGSGTVTNSGTGTLILAGVNTYTGDTGIGAGTVRIFGVGQLGSGTYAGAIVNNGVFNYVSSVAQTLSGLISGTGTNTVSGTGTLTLPNGNTYSGGTTVSAGTLSVSSIADSGTSSIGNSGTLTLSGGTLSYSGAAAATTDRAVSVTVNNSTINLTNGSLTLSNTTATASGKVLVKTGGGTLALTGTNDNSWLLLNVVAGEVQLGKNLTNTARAVAGISGIASGATVRLTGNGGDQIYGGNNSSSGVQGLVAGGTLNLNGLSEGVSFLSGTGGIVEGGASGTPTLTVGEFNFSSTFGGVIQNSGSTLSLTKVGSGTNTLTGTNTYTGSTTISAGMLAISGAGRLGGGTYTGDITNSGTFNYGSSAPQTLSGLLFGTGTYAVSGGSTLTLTGNTTSNVNITVTNASTLQVGNGGTSGALGTGVLDVNGSSTLLLNRTDGGSVNARVRIGLTGGNNNLRVAAGTWNINADANNIDARQTTTWTVDAGATVNVNTNGSGDNIGVSGANMFLVLDGAGTGVINRLIGKGGAANSLIKNGAGTWMLTAAYNGGNGWITGGLTISNGVLAAGADNVIPWGNSRGGVTVISPGILDLSSGSVNINGLDGNGTVRNTGATGRTLTLGNANSNGVFSGVIQNTGSGVLSLTKTGAGTQTLSGANTYTGNTVVDGGTLELAQSFPTLALGSTVSITNGAALQLTVGTVTNKVVGLVTNGVAAGNGLYSSANSSGLITGSGYLLVGPSGPAVPGTLTNSVTGGGTTLSLSWPIGGWRLEQQTNALSKGLSTNWLDVTPGSATSTNITIDKTKGAVFYRLTYP